MIFKRKIYQELLDWKEKHADSYGLLIEGPKGVGKSTIVEEFAKKEYASYIFIRFSNLSKEMRQCFEHIYDFDIFFLQLQAITKTTLYLHKSLIVFDDVQYFPPARQAIKYLAADGRYHYIETGSFVSLHKNTSKIIIPSEEMHLTMYPMDYEEFTWAIGSEIYSILQTSFESFKNTFTGYTNQKLMRDFRIYMAVGGMPQAVESYIKGDNFAQIDQVKRKIIQNYDKDFNEIDPRGKLSKLYHSIPNQLASQSKHFSISKATGKRRVQGDNSLLFSLLQSYTVLRCNNIQEISPFPAQPVDIDHYKLYATDIGLLITLAHMDKDPCDNDIYAKLLNDKMNTGLGFLYENVVAQMIASSKRNLYYYIWKKKKSVHPYEIDFLFSQNLKLTIIEMKSSRTDCHASLDEFLRRYKKRVGNAYLLSQNDYSQVGPITTLPIYLLPFVL